MKNVDGQAKLLNDDGIAIADCEYHEAWDRDSFLNGLLVCHGTREDYPLGVYGLLRDGDVEAPSRTLGFPTREDSAAIPTLTISYVPIGLTQEAHG